MSENTEQKYPRAIIVPVPYMVLDAAFMEWFTKTGPITDVLDATRQTITQGSAEYIIGLKEHRIPMAVVWLRAVNLEGTRLMYFPHQTMLNVVPLNNVDRYMQGVTLALQRFLVWEREEFNAAWAETERQRARVGEENKNIFPQIAIDSGQDIPKLLEGMPAPKRARGRPTSELNQWVRDEIALGRDRRDVFAAYIREQHIDLEDARALDMARERFKKALAREEKGRK